MNEMRNDERNPDIHFMVIIYTTMNKICDLSETLSPAYRRMVANIVRSIAEAPISPSAWMPPFMRTKHPTVSS